MSAQRSRNTLLITLGAAAVWFLLSLLLYRKSYPESPSLLPLIPLGLLGCAMAVYHFRGFLLAMVFIVPCSIGIPDVGGGFGVAIPDEPMLLLAAVGIGLMILRGQLNPVPLLLHPIGLVIILMQCWALVSLAASSYHEVSAKFWVARSVYILVYYIGFGTLFQEREYIVRFIKAHLWGLVPAMIFAILHLAQYGLSRKFSPVMAEPFYDDHTVFGACLAMFLPLAAWVALQDRLTVRAGGRWNHAWWALALVAAALILSFSRAAWMGCFVMGGMWLFMRLRIRFTWLVAGLLVVAAGAWIGRDKLVERFEQNENVSGEDLVSTAASVTNVTTDDSNRERINRWACALRMYEQRPWMGYGPGTYERNYGDFQLVSQITRISTWAGDRGDAHSEYLGVLAEQGLPGLFLLGGLFLMSLRVGMRAAYLNPDRRSRTLAIAIVLGLSSYYFHGFVNDFIDIDKAAVLIWGMLGMLAALGLQTKAANAANAKAAPSPPAT